MFVFFFVTLSFSFLSSIQAIQPYTDNSCSFAQVEAITGQIYNFDLRGLFRQDGYGGNEWYRDDVQWTFYANICGDTPYICADGVPQYTSTGAIIQELQSSRAPTTCPLWDPPFGRKMPCTKTCIPVSYSKSAKISFLDINNIATGEFKMLSNDVDSVLYAQRATFYFFIYVLGRFLTISYLKIEEIAHIMRDVISANQSGSFKGHSMISFNKVP